MLASSSTFWMRLATVAWSRINWVRCRVRSRSSRIAGGGMKLGESRPCWSSCAIHSASLTSVLRPGTCLSLLGVDQDDLEVAFQEVEDRLPVDPGRFHGDVADAFGLEPVGQRQQVGGHGAEGADLGADGAIGTDAADAGDDGLLVDVQPGAAIMKGFHRSGSVTEISPSRWGDLAGGAVSSSCSPGVRGATGWGST